jgi:hypothetical protein
MTGSHCEAQSHWWHRHVSQHMGAAVSSALCASTAFAVMRPCPWRPPLTLPRPPQQTAQHNAGSQLPCSPCCSGNHPRLQEPTLNFNLQNPKFPKNRRTMHPATPCQPTCISSSKGIVRTARPASAVPTIDAVINMAKMNPWGSLSPAGLRAGVQRNTKVYMDASKRAWLAPRSATRASAGRSMVRRRQGGTSGGDGVLSVGLLL